MRPVAAESDSLRNPLNDLLGTPANVRLLRLLAEDVSGPIGAPEAAEHTGLTETGARRALKRLARTGFVERLGGGRSQRFQLRDSDPLIKQLVALFRTERDRYQMLVSQLKDVFRELPEVQVAWIDEPPSAVDQPLHIGVLADSNALSYLRDEIRRRILGVEHGFDVTIEIHTFSRADSPSVDWDAAPILGGHPPQEELQRAPDIREHSDRVIRSERMSQAIADILDRDPSLVRRAERHLDHLVDQNQGTAAHDLREWREIISHYSRQRLKDFLTADTPRAQRLRQSSPFFAVLSPDEREAVFDAAGRDDP